MTLKELAALPLEDQRKWADRHSEELGELVYEGCGEQYNKTGSVYLPTACFYCKGCPIKAIVEGITR